MPVDKYPSIFSRQIEAIVSREVFRAIARVGKYLMDYNSSYMRAKPMKSLELDYPMIRFLIMENIPEIFLNFYM